MPEEFRTDLDTERDGSSHYTYCPRAREYRLNHSCGPVFKCIWFPLGSASAWTIRSFADLTQRDQAPASFSRKLFESLRLRMRWSASSKMRWLLSHVTTPRSSRTHCRCRLFQRARNQFLTKAGSYRGRHLYSRCLHPSTSFWVDFLFRSLIADKIVSYS